MRWRRIKLVAVLAAALLPLLFAGKPAAQYADRQPAGWTGTIRYRVKQAVTAHKDNKPTYTTSSTRTELQDWEAVLNPDGTAHVTYHHHGELHSTTTSGVGASAKVSRLDSVTAGGYSERVRFVVSIGPFGDKGLYHINFTEDPRTNRECLTTTVTATDSPTTVSKSRAATFLCGLQGKRDPGTGALVGTVTSPLPPNMGEEGGGEARWEWNLTSNEKLEVVVEIPDYEKWLPKGTKDEEKAGNTLEVKATLKTKDGSPLQEKARKFTFALVRVSHEPGVCMNYPAKPKKDPDPDLQFDRDAQQGLIVVDDKDQPVKTGLKARTNEGAHTQATAVVGAYDWGAYGEIRVTAVMPDKREIIGYLKTDKSRPFILIPKRKDRSFIADAWKEKWKKEVPNIFELADDDDTEDDPGRLNKRAEPGPGTCRNRCDGHLRCLGGHKGDGLTLYEEYRGFYVGGKHRRTNPGKKDVFIHSRPGTNAGDGIMLFRTISGLAVHEGLTKDEIGPTQSVDFDSPGEEVDQDAEKSETVDQQVWVNANVSKQTPTRGAKFGILISRVGRPGAAVGYGYPGVPKKVAISNEFHPGDWHEIRTGKGAQILTNEYPTAIAHELLHCCNVAHHGPRPPCKVIAHGAIKCVAGTPDRKWVYWKLDGEKVWETQADEETSNPIPGTRTAIPLGNFKWEDGTEITREQLRKWLAGSDFLQFDAGALLYLACQGGQHSGYQDCVMRYDLAAAFIPKEGDDFRYLNRKRGKDFELTGTALCDQQEDTEVPALNLGLQKPLPPLGRYGDAPNGFCRSQICVNDWFHAKP
jgi:hypothetical protein